MKKVFYLFVASCLAFLLCGCDEEYIPELNLSNTAYEIPAEGGVYYINYSVANPMAGGVIKASCLESVDWISSFDTSKEGVVSFTVDANELPEDRSAVIELAYAPSDIKQTVTVKQLAAEIPETPKQADFIGKWNVVAEKWNLDGKSWCYQMDDDSDDGYAHDENGNYIIISVKQYCEEYAAAWNADPDNASSGYTATAEDMAYRLYSDIEMKGTFTFTNDSVNFDWGLTNGFTVNMMNGKYTYDETTCVAKINDTAVEDDPRDLSMNIAFAEDGMMSFEYTEFHLYTFSSYDGTKEYWINAPLVFYCEPVK